MTLVIMVSSFSISGSHGHAWPEGAGWFSLAVAAQMAGWTARARPTIASLTRKEESVLRLIAQAKSNKEIATALGMKEGTVEFHVSKILGKLNLASRVEAALWAKEHGLEG